ncbi:MAG: ATP-binding protein [Deltaproteobacteria bacterium]|nr:ATP-binding protein [Deltaproteobacteria bacterium]
MFELDQLAKEEGKKQTKTRFLYEALQAEGGRHFIGIVGPRGAGKTVLLKQLASQVKDSFYLSLDTFKEEDLFAIAKTLQDQYGIQRLFLDEVHFFKEFDSHIKQIYDFLHLRVYFTSSVALAMIESSYDLSRRIKLFFLNPFSFREYLFFTQNILLPPLSLSDILERRWEKEHLRYPHAFESYLKGGLHPFSLEEPDILTLLSNILQRILHEDIPTVARLHLDELASIEKLITFIAKSPVEGINYSSLSNNIGITKYKAEQYVNLLEKAFVLMSLMPAGTNVLREPKVLMYLPFRLLYKEYPEAIGALREDFTVQMLKTSHQGVTYLKSNRGAKTPDFLVQKDGKKIILEVGGRGKGMSQFKGMDQFEKVRFVHDETTEGNRRPLFLLGFLESVATSPKPP